ncbi:hypothetical protein [Nocardiopsis sp. B62]|uniref:hypothetical protein n=1 Tax=Nocardiopsis sp. B62 TaxID=2824874 RepID=UPI001B368C45|nr:hypothetical protein [Nocardiopsis sp. B62]MBQ1080977.1 hypothetical protein [Nocardiopsis sp. B62]
MTHPIPAPRPSNDSLGRNPLWGPACTSCEHHSCRSRRAQHLPRLGGHLAEYRPEHALAASLQARNPHLIIWFGESTMSYWMASSTGLSEVPDAGTLQRLLTPGPAHR